MTQNKAIAKSMKSTSGLLLHYEQTLKTELETRKASYNRDREEYEKRITSYRGSFQSYKEYYYNNPLAQKLLGLQGENREIEARIKNYDEEITSKQEELDNLTAPVIQDSAPENISEGDSEQIPENEPEKQPEEETVEANDTSFQPIMEEQIPSDAVSEGDGEEAQNSALPCLPAEEDDVGGSQQLDDEHPQEEKETEVEDQEAGPRDAYSGPQHPSIEEQFTVLELEQAMEVEMDEDPEVDLATNKEADETLTSLSQASSQEEGLVQASPARTKPDLATSAFPFTFSPGTSPQMSDSSKSPAFSFQLHSEPSTPGFFGFGAQDEDQSSPFTSSFFGGKKAAESKTSMEFLFNQPEQSGDFEFSFGAKSPDTRNGNKDKSRDDFPFSFNF